MSIYPLLFKTNFLTSGLHFKRVLREDCTSQAHILEEIYKLRYEVYCLECNYLAKQCYHAAIENDEYDECSTHFAAYALKTDTILGTARLIQPKTEQIYPLQNYCTFFDQFSPPPQEQTAEVSRLIIQKNHRRKQSHDKRLLLGIYKNIYLHSRENGIRYWYAAMEDSLAHSLAKMGFEFFPIGPTADYYGPIKPYLANFEQLTASLRKKNPFLAAWFNDEPIPTWLWVKTSVNLLNHKYFKRKHPTT
jgi:N-acyl-L-homoserine lactone synthetase